MTGGREDGGMMRRDGTEVILSLLLNTCESLILLFLLFPLDRHMMSSYSSHTPCGFLKSFLRVLPNYFFIAFLKLPLTIEHHKTVVTFKRLANKLLGGYILPLKAKMKKKITS